MKRINIALTDEQHERMFRYLDINWSHVARAAFECDGPRRPAS